MYLTVAEFFFRYIFLGFLLRYILAEFFSDIFFLVWRLSDKVDNTHTQDYCDSKKRQGNIK